MITRKGWKGNTSNTTQIPHYEKPLLYIEYGGHILGTPTNDHVHNRLLTQIINIQVIANDDAWVHNLIYLVVYHESTFAIDK